MGIEAEILASQTAEKHGGGWTADFAHSAIGSFEYSLVQAPTSGVVQLFDHVTGSDHMDSVRMFAPPKPAEMGSAEWYGSLVGSTAATMLHFGLLHRLVGTGAASQLERESGYGLRTALPSIAKSAMTGVAFGTLFSPVDESLKGKDFWTAKLEHASVSGATFGTLTAGAIGLRSTGSRFLANDIVSNSLAGVPAGIVDSDLRSLMATGHLSSWNNRLESVAQFTAGGAMAGGANLVHEHFAPTSGIRGVRSVEDMTKLADTTISQGHPERYSFDKAQSRLPRADELMKDVPSEWYNRAAVEMRRNIDSSHMSIEQRKLLVSGTQEMAYGLDAIANRPNSDRPIMTIYGSARVQPGTFDYEVIRYIAGRAVHMGYDVQAGGGPGIMEAANRGAFEAMKPVYDAQGQHIGYNANSIGIVIKLPFENGGTNGVGNGYQTLSVLARNFYTRAEMLNQAGPGGVFVVGAGGVGSAAEGLNTITQLQTNKMAPAPVFFVGSKNWGQLNSVFKTMAKTGFISPGDMNLYKITDNPNHIFSTLADLQSAKRPPNLISE
jgi:predicted Rossmann-fold nucleotide-binding protein